MMLHVISWNACGVKTQPKITSLKACVGRHHPDIILIQEAFVVVRYLGQRLPISRVIYHTPTMSEMVLSHTFITPSLTKSYDTPLGMI